MPGYSCSVSWTRLGHPVSASSGRRHAQTRSLCVDFAEGTGMKDVVIVGGGLAGLAAGMEAAALGHGAAGVRQPGGWPHPLGAARPVLAELGRARVRRPGIVHRRPPVRGGHHRGAGARRAGGAVDERQARCSRGRSRPTRSASRCRSSSRIALVKAGIKVSGQVLRYARIVRRRPGEDPARPAAAGLRLRERPQLPDFVGDLPEDAEALFYPTVTRSAADPHEISAGAGIGYFSLVWNIGQGLNRGIVGGPSTLTQGDRQRPRRARAARRRGRRDRPHASARSSSGTGRTAWTARSRGAASSWRPRRR